MSHSCRSPATGSVRSHQARPGPTQAHACVTWKSGGVKAPGTHLAPMADKNRTISLAFTSRPTGGRSPTGFPEDGPVRSSSQLHLVGPPWVTVLVSGLPGLTPHFHLGLHPNKAAGDKPPLRQLTGDPNSHHPLGLGSDVATVERSLTPQLEQGHPSHSAAPPHLICHTSPRCSQPPVGLGVRLLHWVVVPEGEDLIM